MAQWVIRLFTILAFAFTLVLGFSLNVSHAAAAVFAEKRVALVIGNDNYRTIPRLANAANDGRRIASKLVELGFDVIEATDVNLSQMKLHIRQFEESMKDADAALVFFAGHGFQIAGENYLLPVDFESRGSVQVVDRALRLSELRESFSRAAPKVGIIILDACRDNPFGARGIPGGLAAGQGVPGAIMAFAAAPGSVAEDGRGGNSPFTTALLNWVDQPGIEVATLFRRVRHNVRELTGGAQTPWVEEALLKEWYFVPHDRAGARREASVAPEFSGALWDWVTRISAIEERGAAIEQYMRLVPDSARAHEAKLEWSLAKPADGGSSKSSTLPPVDKASVAWLAVRNSKYRSELENFLKEYPGSPYEELARTRIAAMVQAATIAAPIANTVKEFQFDKGWEEAARISNVQWFVINRALRQVGYKVAVRESVGRETRAAIRDFQRSRKLPPTGYIDNFTLQRLIRDASDIFLDEKMTPNERRGLHQLAAYAFRGIGSSPVIVRWHLLKNASELEGKYVQVARKFEAQNPGVSVAMTFIENQRYKEGLLASLGSAEPPDIIYTWGGGHLNALVDSGLVRDLTPQIASDWALTFKPGALRNFSVRNRIYGVPMQFSLVSLWYNKSLLQQSGVDPDSIKTWNDFLSAVKRIKSAGLVPLAVGGKEGWPLQFYLSYLALRGGGEVAVQGAILGQEIKFSDPPFVEAAEMFRELLRLEPFGSGYLGMSAVEAEREFASGRAAMILTGDFMLPGVRAQWKGGPQLARKELGRLDFPLIDGRTASNETFGGIEGWAVRTEAPREAELLLELLLDASTQRQMASEGLLIPVTSAADADIKDPVRREMADVLLRANFHQIYLDQALGASAGAAFNAAAIKLTRSELDPRDIMGEVDTLWRRVLQERGSAPRDVRPRSRSVRRTGCKRRRRTQPGELDLRHLVMNPCNINSAGKPESTTGSGN